MAVLKKLNLRVSTLQGCGGLESPDLTVSTLGRYGSLERNYFMFLLWEGLAVLKKLNLTVSTLQGCGGLERTGFNSFYFARVWWS